MIDFCLQRSFVSVKILRIQKKEATYVIQFEAYTAGYHVDSSKRQKLERLDD